MKIISNSFSTIQIKDIEIKKRLRKELGDLSELINSLKTIGLLNPIVVNQNNYLIAGERRLAAAKKLKWKTIDVRIIHTKGKLDELNLEIEENLHRKSFTYQELENGIKKRQELMIQKDMPLVLYLLRKFLLWIENLFG